MTPPPHTHTGMLFYTYPFFRGSFEIFNFKTGLRTKKFERHWWFMWFQKLNEYISDCFKEFQKEENRLVEGGCWRVYHPMFCFARAFVWLVSRKSWIARFPCGHQPSRARCLLQLQPEQPPLHSDPCPDAIWKARQGQPVPRSSQPSTGFPAKEYITRSREKNTITRIGIHNNILSFSFIWVGIII